MIEAVAIPLQQAQSIYIATHFSPDGDAVGSTLGLAWALKEMGKSVTVACADPAPISLSFVPGSDLFVPESPTTQDLILVLDTGDAGRMGSIYTPASFGERTVINIDHHVSNTRFGTINIIDPHAAAVGEMIYDLVRALNVPLSPAIATCILTAIVTDTLCFRTSSVTPHTLSVAASLMEASIPLSEIVQQCFENRPLAVMRVWGLVLSSYTVEGRIAWASIPLATMEKFGVEEDDIKGLVNQLRGTVGVDVSALIMDGADGKVKAEFRSGGKVDVATIATALGGGGHRAASGCSLPGPLAAAERRILNEIRKQIGQKPQAPA